VLEPVFLRCGLTIGDCLTERLPLGFEIAFFADFRPESPALVGPEFKSMLKSIGEVWERFSRRRLS